jgi:hypothetical protein
MSTFSNIQPKDYTIEELFVSAPMSWQLLSGSNGVQVSNPDFLEGAITVQRASNTPEDFYDNPAPKINEDTGTYEYVMYRSIKHLFYNEGYFYSGSVLGTSSLAGLPEESYVVSVGQQFYGERIKPGSFELATEVANKTIVDDEVGNLYVSESGVGTYIGNVFYDKGIAVIKHDTGSAVTAIGANGLKLVENSELYVDYESDVKFYRHETYVKIAPSDFNFSMFNPSILRTYQASGSVSASFFTASMQQENIKTSGSSDDTYNIYNLMSAGVIKPYITTIGLYNERYELLAVAKLSEPIQRTFNTDQIFIVRFDT